MKNRAQTASPTTPSFLDSSSGRHVLWGRVIVSTIILSSVAASTRAAEDIEPIRVLLITGGCCHEYDFQASKLVEGTQQRAHVEWKVLLDPRRGTRGEIDLYDDPNWAEGYDVVVHNECFADTSDPEYIRKITEVHKAGVPAVVIHCAMHTYRAARIDDWREFLGVTSMHHEHQSEYPVKCVAPDHPIMRRFPDEWVTPRDELYIIRKVWPNTTPLAVSKSELSGEEQPVFWTSQYGKARVFGTTYGHGNATFNDPVFINTLTRGLLWTVDKLNDDYLKTAAENDAEEDADEHGNAGDGDQGTDSEDDRVSRIEVPDGFEVSILATPPEVNYPVFVAASPSGDLYVSVDKNSSLDREPNRGSVLRLRDMDGDGKADEVKTFIPNVDSPRGLVWDHDRLYLMHPPHLSAFIDDDGVADREEILVKNIAFGFEDRPADHTSNGVTLGIDGWLYLAIGDFGFMEAEGADGRKLQLRGGGVVRVRPDGTGLELYSRGTRNILEVALDPLLNGFARDNTNDGGGWDIRLHHFTGLEHHGYPTLFANFTDEAVAPLGIYGGGSGCGGLYLSEPGFPEGYADALYTADWGREIVYRHRLTPNGATFKDNQHEFVKLPRVTDLDVDAMSRLYLASWEGAQYTYNGEDVGYIVMMKPTGYEPEPLPDLDALSRTELVQWLQSPSQRRRLEAQRALLRQGLDNPSVRLLTDLAKGEAAPLPSRVAALFTLKQGLGIDAHDVLAELATDAKLRPFAIRALTDRWDQLDGVPADLLIDGLEDENARTRLESIVALARLGDAHLAGHVTQLLDDPDPVIAHTAVQALIRLGAADACLAIVDSHDAPLAKRTGALRVLQSLHEAPVVDALIERLASESDAARRDGLFAALCRLHFQEGMWRGNSWGTRPDTRGPYYQPEPWEATDSIAAALTSALDDAPAEQAEEFLAQLSRHRIYLDSVLEKLIADAADDDILVPTVIRQLAEREDVPDSAVSLLLQFVSREPERGRGRGRRQGDLRTSALAALARQGSAEAMDAVLTSLGTSDSLRGGRRGRRGGFGGGRGGFGRGMGELREALLKPDVLQDHIHLLIQHAEREPDGNTWADAALVTLAASSDTSPEVREVASRAVEAGWANASRRARLLNAILMTQNRSYESKIRTALSDEDDAVAAAAQRIARFWRLDPEPTPAATPLKTMDVGVALAAAVETKGDAARGRALYQQLNCAKCHTVEPGEPLVGPYLPNVVKTYKRDQLAESILLPGKSIAQGFVTHLFVLDSGKTLTGFVTSEADDVVTIRDQEGNETRIPTSEIEERIAQDGVSMMPENLVAEISVNDLASLLDYLQSLSDGS